MEAGTDGTDYNARQHMPYAIIKRGTLRVVSASVPSSPQPAQAYMPPKTGELKALSREANISEAFESLAGAG